jgi:hypothetical protein
VLQLVQLGGDPNWLRGDGSTFSLFLGVGVGLLVLGLVREPAADSPGPHSAGPHSAGPHSAGPHSTGKE